MSNRVSATLHRLRNPAHTGENRCLPCTVVNVCIALGLGGAATLVAVELAIAVLVVSAGTIYLRGYLVPGTPTLTKRYLPRRVKVWFGKQAVEEPTEERRWETLEKLERERENAVDSDEFLAEVGAVDRDHGDADGVPELTDSFADRIEARLAERDGDEVDRATLAELFDTDPDGITREDREYPAFRVDYRIRKWPSSAAFRVDVATHEALLATTDRWAEVPLEQRLDILRSLRSYHETCPTCGTDLVLDNEAIESCCGAYEVAVLDCPDCAGRFLELDPEVAQEAPSASTLRVSPDAVRGH